LLLACALVAIGLLLLVVGGESLLRGAVGLATLLRLTPAVIGLTVVAAGTSVPELAVSFIAAARGSTDIAIGNVVGSNLFNTALILGLCAMVRPLLIGGNTIRYEYPVLVIVTLLCIALIQDASVSRLDALLFIAVYIAFTAYMVKLVRNQLSEAEVGEFSGEVEELAEATARSHGPLMALLLIVGGSVVLGLGAHFTVAGSVQLARLFGWSERIIGLTIVACGTSLPEVVTSLISSYRGRDDVAMGNVMGSNLFNILGILGISGMVAPLSVNRAIIASDAWWMLGVTVLLFPLMITGRRISRGEGVLLTGTYCVYLVLLVRPS
jgi:cation:H+ antiporter